MAKPILIAGLVLTALMSLVPLAAADWAVRSSDTIEQDVYALSHTWIRWTTLTTSDMIEFEWTTGLVACNFYVMDETNYNLWTQSNPSAGAVVARESRFSDAYNWTVPSSLKTWYAIWFNPSLISTHCSGTWTQYQSIPPPIPGFPWPATAAAVLLALVTLLAYRRRRVSY